MSDAPQSDYRVTIPEFRAYIEDRPDDEIHLAPLGVSLALAEIYRDVPFD